MIRYLILLLILSACATENDQKENARHKDTVPVKETIQEVVVLPPPEPEIKINDSLNTIASIISGNCDSAKMFTHVLSNKHYKNFSSTFSNRWLSFDTSRVVKLKDFSHEKLGTLLTSQKTLFYPFSGPDILHANIFFPDAERYVLIALEPVGSIPDFKREEVDSLKGYYQKLNTSLNAILKFSFFRTESMSKDLKNEEVDGSIHLLLLFLNRLGNSIVSAKPITLDSLGEVKYLSSFDELKKERLKTEGVEVVFKTPDNKRKILEYYSLNAVDYYVKTNKGFSAYLNKLNGFNTYLKGASYLLHKGYFSIIRNKILDGSSTIVQDDSGIALKYFEKDRLWNYTLFGEYTKPVSLFRKQYQADLDSLYKTLGSSALGFGLGYNFKDKNSNLMVINRK